ncbi:short-chain dehydrogenase/reductase [Sphaerisporangium siamense]|uniref:NAD(P)-dependent dehydrogenase (Short-subunit alcohol dehydrogenase family) n=1 Tax=Sphaerisporangium siamense TaxID=795645 RepID=A0A7W7DE06_9ACTN|nr:SDR family NAD(P)-dependent oxidoreductase [Sphaerisporangium siamense]MBB4704255.1 NAD(P)-dependent dehydrogenase (short-subunit alcohol dehydrogenase family) [Sphaerisporangium siamense]GII85063.1 short-chain dehydrogenase/reductase [Sphaerisporangium siamense]
MSNDPAPRRWLITGANSGFGDSFARAALAAGDVVVAAVRRPETVAALAAAHPGRVTVVELDVRDAAACARAVEAAGRVDVLVNNAGYGIVGAVEETSEEEFRDALEVMFHGPLRLTRLVLPQMRARRGGTIVQVTSMGGLLAFAGTGAYCAAKGALEQASEALAVEVRPLGIGILIVEPGAFRTSFAGPALRRSAPLDDYAATAGATAATLSASDGTQPGDPDKAAAAVLAALDLPEPPLRLALGDDAIAAIRAKLAAVAEDLDATAHLGQYTSV